MRNTKRTLFVFGRIHSVSTEFELFHLRLLLLHVKGATNFDSLKTVNGHRLPSFSAACLALGLKVRMMPQRLFVGILIHCQPLHPEKLCDEFKDAMSEDFSRNNDVIVSYQMAYAHINSLLINENRSLADFPTMERSVEIDIILPEENNTVQMREIGEQQCEQLNDLKKEIVDCSLCG